MEQRRQINKLEPVTGKWSNFLLNFFICCGWLFKWILMFIKNLFRKDR